MGGDERDRIEDIAPALGMLAHDLRNPASAILANLNFLEGVRDALPADERDALSDALVSVRDLMTGVEHLGWIARALRDEPVVSLADADAVLALRTFAARSPSVRLDVPDGPLRAHAASGLPRVLELLVSNAAQHAPGKPVDLRAAGEAEHVVVTVLDAGSPVALPLRADAFELRGQTSMKGRADGRYGRMLGLVAAGILARSMDATLEAGEERGRAVFVVRLRRA